MNYITLFISDKGYFADELIKNTVVCKPWELDII